jgi:dienelactone hydrolase
MNSSASAPTRRDVLGQSLAVGALLACAPSLAIAAKNPTATQSSQALFDRFMVRGPFPVKNANPLSYTLPDQNRDLLVRVNYPDPAAPNTDANFPVVVFSHGECSSKDRYNAIADHWASHGIVTVLPTHRDSGSLGYVLGSMSIDDIITSRIADMQFLINGLDDVANDAPALAGRIAKDKLAVGGHGLGSLIALALAGLPLKLEKTPMTLDPDPRIKALVSYNGMGPLPFVGDDWHRVTIPVLAAGGTNDGGTFGDNFAQTWRWRMSPYSLTGGKDRYGVSVTSGDHSYGGLIFHDAFTLKPDATGLAIVNAISTMFLDAELMGDKVLQAFLRTVALQDLTSQRGFLERA